MNSHSDDNRHHYGLLLEAASGMKEESDINILSADGKVRLYFLSCKSGLVHGVPRVPLLSLLCTFNMSYLYFPDLWNFEPPCFGRLISIVEKLPRRGWRYHCPP